MINEIKLITLTASIFIFFSCSEKREIKILGYSYPNDRIIVTLDGNILYDRHVYGTIDKNNLCTFYEPKIKISASNLMINFKIDSSGVSIIDTLLLIPKENKAPFVSFLYPSVKYKFKRKIILGDDNNDNFIKY